MKTKPCNLLFPALLAFIPSIVSATTFSWITAGDGNWNINTNWAGSALPGIVAGDTTLFNAAGVNAAENIYVNATTRDIPGSMVINNTGTTSILGGTAGAPATNSLTGINNITVNAGAGTVNIGTSGAVVNVSTDATGTTGYVNNSSNLLTFSGTLGSNSTTRPVIMGGSGDILLSGALTQSRNIVKYGTGTLTVTAANTLTTSTAAAIIGGGTLKLVDAGTLPSVTTVGFKLGRQATFLLDNGGTTNSTDRLANTAPIASDLGGGTFSFHGANDAASTETVGVLTPASGVLTIHSAPGADHTGVAGTPSNTLTFASLARTAGATLVFSGTGLGSDGTNKIIFDTTAPTLTNHLIGGFATLGNEFATYNEDGTGTTNTLGVQAVAAAGYTTTFGAVNNVKLIDTDSPALGTEANTLNLQTAAAQAFTIDGTLTTGAILNNNAGTGTNSISGGTLGNGTSELILTTNSALDISSSLIGNGVLTKSGTGTLTLGGAGATRTSANVFINQGILKITSSTALYNTAAALSGKITVGANATLEVATNTTWTTSGKIPALTLNDNGATLKTSGNSTFTFDKNVVVTSQANGDATSVNLTAAAAGDTIQLNSAVQNATASTAAPVINVNSPGTVFIASNASNATAAGSALNGSYTWIIDGGGRLLVTSSGASPLGVAGNSVTITSGILGLGNDATTNYAYILNGGTLSGMGGSTRTIATASTIKLAANSTIDLLDAAVGATANMNLGFGGVISGTGALTVAASGTGTGTLTLSGSNTYIGNTTITSGTVALSGSGSIASSPVITIHSGSFLNVSALAGGWSMGATQTLKGNGTVTGSLIAATGVISPGASTGSLAVSSSADLSGSTLAIDIDDAQAPKCDTLAVSGTLNISGATLNLAVAGTPTQSVYIIATYGSNQLTGAFAPGYVLPPGYEIDYTYNANTAIAIKQSSTGGNTYADWLSTKSPATGFETDSDHDGIPNGVENILGTNPNTCSQGLIEVAATATSLTFKHALNPTMASDVTRSYQWSTDLVDWRSGGETNNGGTTATITPSAPAAGIVTVIVTITHGPANKLFGRLVATQQ